jgi:hypothetical protein
VVVDQQGAVRVTSRFAKVFLLIALVYTLFTAGEMWTAIQMVNDTYQSTQDTIFQISGAISHWLIDPAFMCGTAVMIEFLERIWRELAKRNAAGPQEPHN